MATTQQARDTSIADNIGVPLVSADSHVDETPDFWTSRLPKKLADKVPQFQRNSNVAAHSAQTLEAARPGGHDPHARIGEMEQDGLTAEVVYPTLGLRLFSMTDAAAQEASFEVYNDWILGYCGVAPKRLFAIASIACYNIDNAVKELERCAKAGAMGAMVWQVPHPDLPFTSSHYDPLWEAAQALDMPIHLHILTGFDYSKDGPGAIRGGPIESHRGSVNLKLGSVTNAIFDLIFSGAMERFPKLKVVVVESEIGWIPFMLQQWDYYFNRFRSSRPLDISMAPSEYFYRQMHATLFNDAVGGKLLSWWGIDNCMWSTDYPHPNSTWPHSRELLGEQLGHLPQESLRKLVHDNVVNLYKLKLPGM
jgi:predicted TIM-barrel fold metal-dependent hydrolase